MPRHRKPAAATKANRLMDDVYREMFQLESRRPGAEMALALALIRAGACADTLPQRRELWRWLKQVCPICLKMIEDALAQDASSLPIV